MKKIFFIAFAAMASTCFGQTNKIIFPKGHQLEVSTQMTSSTAMDAMGQSIQSSANSTMTEVFNVKDANNNSATLEHSVKKIQFVVNGGMGQNFSFDSDKDEDRKGDIGKSLDKVLKDKYDVVVDNNGAVTSVQENPNNPKATADNNAMIGMLLSQLNISAQMPKVGEGTVFKILPDAKITKGYTWTDTSSNESGKRKTVYTINDITDKEIIIDFTGEATLKTTQQVMGMDMNVSTSSTGTGKIILDKQTGLLKQKTANVDTKGTIEAQGQSIPSVSKQTITTTVKMI